MNLFQYYMHACDDKRSYCMNLCIAFT